jgi:hypothetical protein
VNGFFGQIDAFQASQGQHASAPLRQRIQEQVHRHARNEPVFEVSEIGSKQSRLALSGAVECGVCWENGVPEVAKLFLSAV